MRSRFQIGGHRRSRVQDAEPGLRRWIAAEPGLTLQELRERLAKQGIAIKIGALWHQLNKWNLTFKKTLHASEQEREDVQAARRAWTEAQPALDLEKLVFIDETWAATNLTRSTRSLNQSSAISSQNCDGIESRTVSSGEVLSFRQLGQISNEKQ